MKRIMTTVLVAACGIACLAQDAPAPAQKADMPKGDAQRAERMQRARLERRTHMMRGMRGSIETKPFGKLADGKETTIYRLKGLGGIILDITDYGGRLVRCYAPDKYGNLADVTLGWNTPGEYETLGFSMGTLIGRYGNRIKDGKFKLDGQEYQLPINEDKKTETTQRHCNLHGGPEGWDKKVWKARPLRMGPIQGLELTYVSKDGEMGFPGTVTCKVTYKVLPNNVWTIDYQPDAPLLLEPRGRVERQRAESGAPDLCRRVHADGLGPDTHEECARQGHGHGFHRASPDRRQDGSHEGGEGVCGHGQLV